MKTSGVPLRVRANLFCRSMIDGRRLLTLKLGRLTTLFRRRIEFFVGRSFFNGVNVFRALCAADSRFTIVSLISVNWPHSHTEIMLFNSKT